MTRVTTLFFCLWIGCAVNREGLVPGNDSGPGDGGIVDAVVSDAPSADVQVDAPFDASDRDAGPCTIDSDEDGTPDCEDACREDPAKTAPGACGCGIPDVDADGDGFFGCAGMLRDCDDDDGDVFPGATEVCGATDDDCDERVDEGIPGACRSGCSDGTREALTDLTLYPTVAACGGGWSIRGLSSPIRCDRAAGNDSTNPRGSTCAAADLCEAGWVPCELADLDGATIRASDCTSDWTTFFASNVGSEMGVCSADSLDRVYGCGTHPRVGGLNPSCVPLSTFLELPDCASDWDCGGDSDRERAFTRTRNERGGVLCCSR